MRRIALVGTGRLASALARSFGARIVAVAGRDASRVTAIAALAAAREVSSGADASALPAAVAAAGARALAIEDVAGESFDVLWIATSDSALDAVARTIASGRPSWSGVVVVHSSGALGVAALAPFAERGASVLALHPNASLRGDAAIAGSTVWGVTPPDVATLDLARRLIGTAARSDSPSEAAGDVRSDATSASAVRLVGIAEEQRALYHAAASTAANFTVSLFAMAARLYERGGVEPALAVAIVEEFMRTSVERSRREGPAKAITGPIVRGDTNVVDAQRAAVASAAPELSAAFDALAALTAMLFADGGRSNEG